MVAKRGRQRLWIPDIATGLCAEMPTDLHTVYKNERERERETDRERERERATETVGPKTKHSDCVWRDVEHR